mmetsp:Transcript_41413/g.47708  ORF Transcript_41413/g.47708 Transcript_41413/m.47708 type:complete len:84 (-) Transcript_41413:809-1060(-)
MFRLISGFNHRTVQRITEEKSVRLCKSFYIRYLTSRNHSRTPSFVENVNSFARERGRESGNKKKKTKFLLGSPPLFQVTRILH